MCVWRGYTMGGLDAFLRTAARLSRVRGGGAAGREAGAALLRQAPGLLAEHPERAPEIALGVRRCGPHDPRLLAPFTADLARLARARLPAEGQAPSRARAREGLVSYVTLCGLGAEGADVAFLRARVLELADLLEAPAAAAALAQLAGGSAEGASEVALALQRPLRDAAALDALAMPDLLAAAMGVARSAAVLPAAADALIATLGARFASTGSSLEGQAPQAAPAQMLSDVTRAAAELRRRRELGDEQRKAIDALLLAAWPLLAAAALRGFERGGVEAAVCLSGLASVASVLPAEGLVAEAFAARVLGPGAPALISFVRADSDALEIAGPLLRQAGGENWTAFLGHLVMEALPGLPRDAEGAARVLAILEGVAASSGSTQETAGGTCPQPAFPPFFDFAIEELLGRFGDMGRHEVRRSVRLVAHVHLERPDLLCSAAPGLAQACAAAAAGGDGGIYDAALGLAATAALYMRVAALGAAGDATSGEGLAGVAEVLEAQGAVCAQLVAAAAERAAERGRLPPEEAAREADAACVALSAFTQVACRAEGVPDLVRERLLLAGLGLLEALSAAWAATSVDLTAPQSHIFTTALRSFCAWRGAPPTPPTAVEVLRSLVAQALVAPRGDREASLRLAMLGEFARDPACPEELRSVLPASAAEASAPEAAAGPGASASATAERLRSSVGKAAAERLRASVAEHASKGPGPTPPPDRRARAGGGFFRRLFGF